MKPFQDSRGNWNNKCCIGNDEPVPSDESSPFTLSLYTAAARAATAQVEGVGLGAEGEATATSGTGRVDKGRGEGIWWPKYSTDKEVGAAQVVQEGAHQPCRHYVRFHMSVHTLLLCGHVPYLATPLL